MRSCPVSILVVALLSLMSSCLVPSYAFSIQPLSSRRVLPLRTVPNELRVRLQSSVQNNADDDDKSQEDATPSTNEVEPVYETVVKMDDGGSDLTDRFKYKVNALMGVFDPQTGVDDERQSGNIMNALLRFPVRYSFNVVGRTNGDEALKEEYVAEIKDIVSGLSGEEEGMELRITPRGKNFTRITLQVTVESVAIINSIYDALQEHDKTVMQY